MYANVENEPLILTKSTISCGTSLRADGAIRAFFKIGGSHKILWTLSHVYESRSSPLIARVQHL
jgi:hypothetical protein